MDADVAGRRLIAMLAQPAPVRPWWQRILLPFVGLICVVVGVIGWLMPVIPGAPLAILGVPMLFCFSRGAEDRARQVSLRLIHSCKRRWCSVRERWQARHHRH